MRISQDRTGAGLGVARQEQDCRALAKAKGWEVVEVYVDNDTSAYRGKKRKGWARMVADARAGKFDAILAWHPDRLTRSIRENEDVIDMAEGFGLVLACVHGDYDLSTPTGKKYFRQAGIDARYESEQKGVRHRRANLQAAEDGKPWGRGVRCFGYTLDGKSIVKDEAAVIRDAVKRLTRGESLRSIVMDLDRRGIRSTRGNPIRPDAFRRLLLNPRLRGKRVHQGQIIADGHWPKILTETQQRKVEAVLNNPVRTTNAKPVRTYLLSGGVLRCGHCGKPMHPNRNSSGNRTYRCKPGPGYEGCGKRRIIADGLEQDVAERVLGRLASPAVRQRLLAAVQQAPDTERSLADEIAEVEQAQRDLGAQYGRGDADNRAFVESAAAGLKRRLAELREQLNQAVQLESLPAAETPEALADWWEHATIEQRRDLVMTQLYHVNVGQVIQVGLRAHDPRRVEFVWKWPSWVVVGAEVGVLPTEDLDATPKVYPITEVAPGRAVLDGGMWFNSDLALYGPDDQRLPARLFPVDDPESHRRPHSG